jgi:hypothetical protein
MKIKCNRCKHSHWLMLTDFTQAYAIDLKSSVCVFVCDVIFRLMFVFFCEHSNFICNCNTFLNLWQRFELTLKTNCFEWQCVYMKPNFLGYFCVCVCECVLLQACCKCIVCLRIVHVSKQSEKLWFLVTYLVFYMKYLSMAWKENNHAIHVGNKCTVMPLPTCKLWLYKRSVDLTGIKKYSNTLQDFVL